MKRKLLFLILLVGMALVGHAQKKDHEVMHREFKEFKVKFMAQEIDLNDKQRDKFYEVYSQMMDERDKVMRDAFRAQRKVKKNKNATEADYKAASDAMADAQVKASQIERNYDEKFATFLTSKQIFKMKEAEHKFRDTLSNMRKTKKHQKRKK